ncbi:MAG: hypothetical protein GXY85_01750 [Candidatus Brocadiaceae bacterium]|nr:hypothetical protein [Candidatus Brocadiaceae bacterium]
MAVLTADEAEASARAHERETPSWPRLCLSARQWLVAAALLLSVFAVTPAVWSRFEPLDQDPDHRIARALNTDYWQIGRYCRQAAVQGRVMLLGDSLVWGQYVGRKETLGHYLNRMAGEARFANLGLDGGHPAALAGLIEYHGDAIAGCRVIVHCNPLWMRSARHDLSGVPGTSVHHDRLVPQFVQPPPAYRASWAHRAGTVLEREVPFFGWAHHLRATRLGQAALPMWTLESPYRLPPADPGQGPGHDAASRPGGGPAPLAIAWVDPDESYQWRSFRRAIRRLRERGNEVFVVLGPINEHALAPECRRRYEGLRAAMALWLTEHWVPHAVPAALPAELYADAGHPLAEGYALLAARLYDDAGFRRFVGADGP